MAGTDLTFGERRFRHTYTTRVALAALTFSVMCVVWSVTGKPELSPQSPFFWACMAEVLINAALFVAIGATVLTISDQGIRRETIFSAQEMRWDQIVETRYGVKPVRPRAPVGLVGVLIAAARRPRRIKQRLTVLSNDGQQIEVTANYRYAREAIGIVLGQVLPGMVASVRGSVYQGETVFFGSLALSRNSIVWKRRSPIPIAAITRAEIVGRNLRIECSGKWTSAIKLRSDTIPNVLVFLDVLGTIAPQLRPSRIDPLARVRL